MRRVRVIILNGKLKRHSKKIYQFVIPYSQLKVGMPLNMLENPQLFYYTFSVVYKSVLGAKANFNYWFFSRHYYFSLTIRKPLEFFVAIIIVFVNHYRSYDGEAPSPASSNQCFSWDESASEWVEEAPMMGKRFNGAAARLSEEEWWVTGGFDYEVRWRCIVGEIELSRTF